MFLMWLGEQITERGIGNGISMIILAGIVAGLPAAVAGTRNSSKRRNVTGYGYLAASGCIAATVFVVYMERAQRRITVNYARRQQGRKMYAGAKHAPAVQDQHVGRYSADFRVEHPDVSGDDRTVLWSVGAAECLQSVLQTIGANLGPGQPIYVLLYAALIIFFCFFYTASDVQLEGHGRQSEAVGRVCSGNTPWCANGGIH